MRSTSMTLRNAGRGFSAGGESGSKCRSRTWSAMPLCHVLVRPHCLHRKLTFPYGVRPVCELLFVRSQLRFDEFIPNGVSLCLLDPPPFGLYFSPFFGLAPTYPRQFVMVKGGDAGAEQVRSLEFDVGNVDATGVSYTSFRTLYEISTSSSPKLTSAGPWIVRIVRSKEDDSSTISMALYLHFYVVLLLICRYLHFYVVLLFRREF